MTTLHKVVLSLIAAICISLIVFYSVKGNQRQPVSVAVAPSASPVTEPAPQPPEPLKAEAARAREEAMRQPVVLGAGAAPRGAGLDDLVAKVRSEIATNEPVDASGAAARHDELAAGANVPTTVMLSEQSEPATKTTPDMPGPIVKLTTTDAATALPATSITEPLPLTMTETPAPAASANEDATVPSFTLGEPPRKELIADADASAEQSGGAKPSPSEKTRGLIDGPIDELAKVAPSRDPLPPLAMIRDKEEPAASPEPKIEVKPEPKTETVAADASKPKDEKPLVIDPHKPAVKAEEPVALASADKKVVEESKATANRSVSSPLPPPVKSESPLAKSDAGGAKPDSKPAGATRSYTVKPGDSYSSIAARELGAERHWMAIEDANPGVDPKRIRVGQVIQLPDVAGGESKPADVAAKTDVKPAEKPVANTGDPAKQPQPATADRIHEVKSGENLSSISRRYFNTPDHWRHIYVTNREVIGGDPGRLQAGMKLKITTPKAE